MLARLRVGNLALAEDLDIPCGPGLTMLTGETGAGKSLVAGALSLLAGAKADRGQIRAGEDLAWVEGVFDLADRPASRERLAGLGIRLAADGILVLRRELRREGRGRVLVNGLVSSLALLEQAGADLLSVQSQDQQRLLARPAFAREFLDTVLGLEAELAAVATARATWRSLADDLARRREEAAFARQQLEMWQYQQRELADMGLDAAEESALAEKLAFARDARSVLEAAGRALDVLSGTEGGAAALLGTAGGALGPAAARSEKVAGILGRVEEAGELVADASRDLERFLDGTEVDPTRLDEMEERKARYEELRRKYDRDVSGLQVLLEELEERIARQEDADGDIARLEAEVGQARDALGSAAEALRTRRVAGAPKVAARAVALIRPLSLPEFELEFHIAPRLAADGIEVDGKACRVADHGADDVTLRVRTNRGEPGGDVARIASGGESSRIYLGLSVLAENRPERPLLLFDEIDAGLGMDNAVPVARLLEELASGGQVVCITHLATVAARGSAHLKAAKRIVGERTVLEVEVLAPEQRLAEVARLLGGEGASAAEAETTRLAYARELLGEA